MVNYTEYAMDKALQPSEDFESTCRYNASASVRDPGQGIKGFCTDAL